MNLIQRIFGMGKTVDFRQLVQDKAAIIDVRTKAEYKTGHIKDAINVPLQDLAKEMNTIKKLNRPVITCCASGVRSGMAKKTLEKEGIEVYNGGAWTSLDSQLK